MGGDLIKAGEESPLAVLQMESGELQGLIRENVGQDALGIRDLDRVKVPAGGGVTWEVPTIGGTEPMKEIEGVIVHRTTSRAFWKDPYSGSNEKPECYSDDGEVGHGDPGGLCAECPYNEWESAGDGTQAKACKETRQLFVLTADSLIPIVVTIPPGSLANVKAYFIRLLRARLSGTDLVTKIGLEKAENRTGIAFSKVTLKAGARLDPDAALRLRGYASALEPAFKAASRVEKDELES